MAARDAKYFDAEGNLLTNCYYGDTKREAAIFGYVGPLAKWNQVPVGTRPDGVKAYATRIIFYKKRPSLHKCDARCMNARGHNCECSCGGANHGKAA